MEEKEEEEEEKKKKKSEQKESSCRGLPFANERVLVHIGRQQAAIRPRGAHSGGYKTVFKCVCVRGSSAFCCCCLAEH